MAASLRGRLAIAVLVAIGVLAIAAFFVSGGGRGHPHSTPPRSVHHLVPALVPIAPPIVEPTKFIPMPPTDARGVNAALPIDTALLLPARPFGYAGSARDRANAVTCLAAAELYEAGDDRPGEEAVAQVVLNRLRHPAFPKSVCGVVFQGSNLATGCQFTFTCDGALARMPAATAWQSARAIAERALGGYVDRDVGTATHYHADYVVPYWRASLDKIAVVHAHIFYRWRGWWGTPAAFNGRYFPPETVDSRLAKLAGTDPLPTPGVAPEILTLHPAPPAVLPRHLLAEGVTPADLRGSVIRLMDARLGRYVLLLDPAAYPGSYAVTAFAICKVRPSCEVMGWTDAALLPVTLPGSPSSVPGMTFLYRKDGTSGVGEAKWDCRQVHRDDPAQCLAGTATAVR